MSLCETHDCVFATLCSMCFWTGVFTDGFGPLKVSLARGSSVNLNQAKHTSEVIAAMRSPPRHNVQDL